MKMRRDRAIRIRGGLPGLDLEGPWLGQSEEYRFRA
jgi:hypothetical protein